MNLTSALLSSLHAAGMVTDGLEDGWSVARNGLSAAMDWTVQVNRRRILRFARRRFPDAYARLDGGDKRIIRSFVDPDWVSNTVSLLGVDPRPLALAPVSLVAAALHLPFPYRGDDASEYFLDLPSIRALARDALGPEAEDATPFVLEHEKAREGRERWFFLNGIQTNAGLARRNADRLREVVGRPFITIYNPTQGLANDLAESTLQKFTNVNTQPSALAFLEIAAALVSDEVERVAVVAHSQGTIIAGDVLDLVYFALDPVGKSHLGKTNMNSQDFRAFLSVSHGVLKSDDLHAAVRRLEGKRKEVEEKLELYLFANAASRVCYLDAAGRRPRIESFANEHDCVARLGCLAEDAFHAEGLLRIDGPLFLRRGRYGHLLNAHYLDDLGAYESLGEGGEPPRARRSLHDPVAGNPCARNASAVTLGEGARSRFLQLASAAAPASRRVAELGDRRAG